MGWLFIVIAVGFIIKEAWEKKKAEEYVEELRKRGEL